MKNIVSLSLFACSIFFSSVGAVKADELQDAIGDLTSAELNQLSSFSESDILEILGLGTGGAPCGGAPVNNQCGGTCENDPSARWSDKRVCTVSPGTGTHAEKLCECYRNEQVKCGSFNAALGCQYGVCEEAGKTCQETVTGTVYGAVSA
jgi:hypothetical protein